jgi:hypothetical protein
LEQNGGVKPSIHIPIDQAKKTVPVKNQLIFSISKIANQRRARLPKSLASWSLFLLVQLFFCITNLQAQTEFIELRFDQKDAPKKAQYFLTGKVSQLETKEAIPGAAIHIDGFFKGNNTDQNGYYFIVLRAFDESSKNGEVLQAYTNKIVLFVSEHFLISIHIHTIFYSKTSAIHGLSSYMKKVQ